MTLTLPFLFPAHSTLLQIFVKAEKTPNYSQRPFDAVTGSLQDVVISQQLDEVRVDFRNFLQNSPKTPGS
jgi:hypothetical protein